MRLRKNTYPFLPHCKENLSESQKNSERPAKWGATTSRPETTGASMSDPAERVCGSLQPREQSRLILRRSAQRHAKEEAMLPKAESRLLTDVGALRKRTAGGKVKRPDGP